MSERELREEVERLRHAVTEAHGHLLEHLGFAVVHQRLAEQNIYSPLCGGCGVALQPANAWMEDGCPCNTPKGVNDGNQLISHWRLLLQQAASRDLAVAQEANEWLVNELVKRDDRIAELEKQLSLASEAANEAECQLADSLPDGRRQVNQLQADLYQWQQFAAYCRSCAISGECDPQDFADFTQGD